MKAHTLPWTALLALSLHSNLLAQGIQPVATVSPDLRPLAGDRYSTTPVLSEDGGTVAFLSVARNLVTNSLSGAFLNVVVADLANRTNRLASVGMAGEAGNGNSTSVSISGDGRRVAFESLASNLAANDNNGVTDVFVRDMVTGVTTLASVRSAGGGSGNGRSFNPKLTSDGRWLLFESAASNLAGAPSMGADIFLRDLQTASTVWVSTNTIRSGSDNALARDPVISANGRFVAWVSQVTNTTANPGRGLEIFLRDMQTGVTTALATNAISYFGGAPAIFDNLTLSSNGQFIAFRGFSTNGAGVFWQDLAPGGSNYVAAGVSNAFLPQSEAAGPVLSGDGRTLAFDLSTNVVIWDSVTRSSLTLGSMGAVNSPLISADGRFVSFLAGGDPVAMTHRTRTQLFVYDRLLGTTNLVSINAAGTGGGSGDSAFASMSADGLRFAFQAEDGDLTAGDMNRATDVFFRDLAVPTVQLVSRRLDAFSSATPGGFSLNAPNGISSNGQFVIFLSYADNLSAADTNGWPDVYVRDLVNRTNILVSVNTNGMSGNGSSFAPILSVSGRYAVFASMASDLVTNDVDGITNLFLRDLQAGTTVKLPSSASIRNPPLTVPSISDDGHYVVYEGRTTPTDVVANAYLYDTQTGTATILNSVIGGIGGGFAPVVSPDGRRVAFAESTYNATAPVYSSLTILDIGAGTRDHAVVNAPCSPGVFSADGNSLAFFSYASTYASSGTVYLRDLVQKTNVTVVQSAGPRAQLSLSADGRLVAFSSVTSLSALDQNQLRDVYVFDRGTGRTTLISTNAQGTAAANGASDSAMISASGRYVVFRSMAPDLVSGITERASHIYIRDLWTGTTSLLTSGPNGELGDNISIKPFFSQDGGTIVFSSASENLVPGDYNASSDLFYFRLPGAGFVDTDNDGLDDNWERRFFGDLSHDGTADSDGDGVSDLDEFRAGTDPTNRNSFFRGKAMQPPVNGAIDLRWSALPGTGYKVQFKNALSDTQWKDLPANITVNGPSAQASDLNAPATQRFYRIVIVQ